MVASMLRTLLLLLVFAACTPPPVTSPGTRPPVAAGTPMTVALGAPGERLAGGRYTRADFQPGVSFEVGAGWTAQQVAEGFFDVQQEVGSPHVIAVQFANVDGQATSRGVVAALGGNPRLRMDEPQTVRVGGRTATRLVVETIDPVDTDPPVFREVLSVPAGPIGIASGRRLQLTLLDTSRGVLAILVGGSIARWDRTLEVAMPVVESVEIER
jgi:hypothetical protein